MSGGKMSPSHHWLTDNFKSRDASASKKLNFKERKVICNDDCNYFDKKGRLKVKVVNRTDSLKQGIWLQLSESLYQRQISRLTKFAREREGEEGGMCNICSPFHIFTRALWGREQIEVFWNNFYKFILGIFINSFNESHCHFFKLYLLRIRGIGHQGARWIRPNYEARGGLKNALLEVIYCRFTTHPHPNY